MELFLVQWVVPAHLALFLFATTTLKLPVHHRDYHRIRSPPLDLATTIESHAALSRPVISPNYQQVNVE